MVSQLTVYAKILCLLMTLFSAGASTGNDIYLQSACSLKFVRAKNGSVFADNHLENGQPQVFSLNATRTRDNRAAVTIYSKETDSYICFDKNWRIKSMRGKANMSKRRCMFFENIDASGGIRYRSVVNQNRSLGFQKNGKPIGGVRAGGGAKAGPGGVGRKRTIDEKCYNFHPSDASGSKQVQEHQQQHAQTTPPPQRQEVKATRPQQQPQQQQQQSSQLQPRQRHHRQQDQRKDVSASEGNALSSYSGGTSDQRQSPPHRHRHKHGGPGGRQGKQQQGHPNLDSGFTGATSSLPSVTLASLYGGNNAYGKGTHHRRSHLNSPVSGDASMLPSALSALVTKLPPKSTAHAGHLGSALGLLDAGGGGGGGAAIAGNLYRKDRPALEPTNGRVSSGHAVGANGKKKSPNGSNGTSGRNASTKVSTMRGRDKRASG
ncbi:uncharacterized protein LOC126568220 [Anopheles maculipalpis]|uniref:uncharacterized protein LOC126568220 n=1 Tax=Anopheles maculipalpis TaxID=1496333 RepID=UPI0021592978|nr:uncharacterized protein LOC126568220 [Anopheles maculipalpis]